VAVSTGNQWALSLDRKCRYGPLVGGRPGDVEGSNQPASKPHSPSREVLAVIEVSRVVT